MQVSLSNFPRRNFPHFLVVIISILAVYIWSMPKTVVLEDDGTFTLAAYFNGIAHPPGYPLYTFLAHWASLIPLGNVVSRVHAFSAVLGTAACIILWLLVQRMLQSRLLATSAALVYGFSLAFWSQAIIAEVYTLNVFLFLLLFLLCLYFRDNPGSKKLFGTICVIYGLALSNHWPLIILSTPLLLAVIWPVIFNVISNAVLGAACIAIGLLPYLWMVINSHLNPPINFYGPLHSLSDFIFMVSREGYKTIDTSSSADWTDKLQFSGFFLQQLYNQFRPFGILFILIGAIQQFRVWPKNISFGLLFGFLGPTFILIGLLGFDFDIEHKNLFLVYPLIAYAIAAIWLVLGIRTVIDVLQEKSGGKINSQFIAVSISVLLVLSTLISNIPANYRANDYMARDYAKVILDSLEPNAVFFTYADIDTGPIGYMNRIEGLRPDVTVYNGQGLVYSNRLFPPLKMSQSGKKAIIHNFIKHTKRPVYFSTSLLTDYGFEDYGLYAKVNPAINKAQRRIVLVPEIVGFIETEFSQGEPYDHWENMLYHLLEYEFCRVTASQVLFRADTDAGNNLDLEKLGQVCKGFYGTTSLAELMLNMKNPQFKLIYKLLQDAESMQNQALRNEDVSNIYNLYAKYYELQHEPDNVEKMLHKSIRIFNNPENHAFKLLSELREKYPDRQLQ